MRKFWDQYPKDLDTLKLGKNKIKFRIRGIAGTLVEVLIRILFLEKFLPSLSLAQEPLFLTFLFHVSSILGP